MSKAGAALAPQLAELVADMAEELRKHSWANEVGYVNKQAADELLTRLAALFPEDSA